MFEAAAFIYQFADTLAFLLLVSLGLAIIFGMMGVINMAHGELLTIGAYTMAALVRLGVPFALAVVLSGAVAGFAGLVLERLVIRKLYGKPAESILATWAISIGISQGLLIAFGPSIQGVGTPLGSVSAGPYSFSEYRIVLALLAGLLLLAIYLVFHRTWFGVQARATIADATMARAMGVNTHRIYAITFSAGCALAGIAGALYGPTMALVPNMGVSFVVPSFVTVIVGGASVLAGVAPAAAGLGLIQVVLSSLYGQLIGVVGLLLAVIVIIRFLPNGISGMLGRRN